MEKWKKSTTESYRNLAWRWNLFRNVMAYVHSLNYWHFSCAWVALPIWLSLAMFAYLLECVYHLSKNIFPRHTKRHIPIPLQKSFCFFLFCYFSFLGQFLVFWLCLYHLCSNHDYVYEVSCLTICYFKLCTLFLLLYIQMI